MKKFLFAVAAMVMVPASAHAQSAQLCPLIGELAGKIMKARQLEIPKATVMGAITPGPSYKLSMSLVDFAYNIPIYPTEQMKATSIENFRMQAEYICYQNFTY